MTVSVELENALESLEMKPCDQATVALARAYASAIDLASGDDDLAKLGPKLLACLEALLMTPKARAAVTKGEPNGAQTSPLDELRARRRKRGAPPVDPAAGGAPA